MRFWIFTIVRYALTALAAFLLAIPLSFLSVMPFIPAGDDSPGLGFLLGIVFLFEASLLVSLSLGVTAELIQRKVEERSFEWLKALRRFLIAIPIAVGPLYYPTSVWGFIESRRPAYWIWEETFLYSVSCLFAYFALRIRRKTRTN